MSVPRSPGVTTNPAATGPAFPPPAAQQCITPPSVRRREARLLACGVQANGGSGDEGVWEGPAPTAYAAEEVDARRAGRRAAQWQGWEREGEQYAGQQVGGGGVVRADGTVDWAALESTLEQAEQLGDVAAPVGPVADAHYLDLVHTLESAPSLPAARPSLPSLPAALDPSSLPAHTLPLVLGALYVLARALGLGSRTQRAENGLEGKVRALGREGGRRE
ncbi:hypothetical protein JCM1840_005086 [Sporobolomyces johnsonii]